MIKRYSRGRIQPQDMQFKTFTKVAFKTDEEGTLQPYITEDITDMSIYGDYTDWSLSAMKEAGINPESFSSPVVSGTRLEASSAIASIDLSSLDSQSE